VTLSLHDWAALASFPLEWAALALLVTGAIYWERAALSGLGIEGCVLSAILGFCLGYEWTGDYAIAAAAGTGGAIVFALVASGILLSLKSDPTVGAFALSLVPACALGILMRAAPLRLLRETPPPGLIPGTIFEGTYAEDLMVSPWVWAVPVVLALAAFIMLKTPYGLRLRGYSRGGRNPATRGLAPDSAIGRNARALEGAGGFREGISRSRRGGAFCRGSSSRPGPRPCARSVRTPPMTPWAVWRSPRRPTRSRSWF